MKKRASQSHISCAPAQEQIPLGIRAVRRVSRIALGIRVARSVRTARRICLRFCAISAANNLVRSGRARPTARRPRASHTARRYWRACPSAPRKSGATTWRTTAAGPATRFPVQPICYKRRDLRHPTAAGAGSRVDSGPAPSCTNDEARGAGSSAPAATFTASPTTTEDPARTDAAADPAAAAGP